jgi:hypothetical protein
MLLSWDVWLANLFSNCSYRLTVANAIHWNYLLFDNVKGLKDRFSLKHLCESTFRTKCFAGLQHLQCFEMSLMYTYIVHKDSILLNIYRTMSWSLQTTEQLCVLLFHGSFIKQELTRCDYLMFINYIRRSMIP